MTEKKRGIEIVRNLENIRPITDVCGEIKALSSREDFEKASLALAIMRAPTIPHYHKAITEFYFVLEGSGRLIVGRNTYEIKGGMLAIIPPNVVHYTIPREVTRVLAFAVPAWTNKDQFTLKETDRVAGYSVLKERFELIDEFLLQGGLGFKKEMTRDEKEELDLERQMLALRVLRVGWNRMSIPELRKRLQIPKSKKI